MVIGWRLFRRGNRFINRGELCLNIQMNIRENVSTKKVQKKRVNLYKTVSESAGMFEEVDIESA